MSRAVSRSAPLARLRSRAPEPARRSGRPRRACRAPRLTGRRKHLALDAAAVRVVLDHGSQGKSTFLRTQRRAGSRRSRGRSRAAAGLFYFFSETSLSPRLERGRFGRRRRGRFGRASSETAGRSRRTLALRNRSASRETCFAALRVSPRVGVRVPSRRGTRVSWSLEEEETRFPEETVRTLVASAPGSGVPASRSSEGDRRRPRRSPASARSPARARGPCRASPRAARATGASRARVGPRARPGARAAPRCASASRRHPRVAASPGGLVAGRRSATKALPSPRRGECTSLKSSTRWLREGDLNARDDGLDELFEAAVGLARRATEAGVPTTASWPSPPSLASKSSSSAKTFASIRSSRRSSMRSASSSRARNEDADIARDVLLAPRGAPRADGPRVRRVRLSDARKGHPRRRPSEKPL